MKAILKLLVLFIFVQANSQNLLQNPGFEGSYGISGDNNGCAPGYTFNPNWSATPSPSEVQFSKETTNYHSGQAAQKAVITNVNEYCHFSQHISITGNRILKASLWVKASTAMTINFGLRTRLTGYPYVAMQTFTIVPSSTWQKIEVIGSICTGTYTQSDIDFQVSFDKNTNGTLYMDDASVTDITNTFEELPELLSNPDMEGFYSSQADETFGCAPHYFYNPAWGPSSTNVLFSREASIKKSGDFSQKAVITGNVNEYCFFQQGVKLRPHRTYKASVWIKLHSGDANDVVLMLKERQTNTVIASKPFLIKSANGWTLIEITGTTQQLISNPNGSFNADFIINLKDNGPFTTTYYIDSASLKDITDTKYVLPNLIKNGEFNGPYGTTGEYAGCAENYYYNPDWNGTPATVSRGENIYLPHSAPSCQQIIITNPIPSYCYFAQGFKIDQNRKLKAELWVRPEENITIELMFRSRKSGNKKIGEKTFILTGGSGWQKLEITGSTGTDVNNISVNNIDFFINFKSAGNICFDDAYVTDITDVMIPAETEQKLLNIDFEGAFKTNGIAENFDYNPQAPNSTPSTVYFSKDTTYPHSGASCQKIQVTEFNKQMHFYQNIANVTGQRIFKATAWVRSTCAETAEIEFTLRKSSANYEVISSSRTLKVGTEWQKIEITGGFGTIVSGSYDVNFFINFRSTGILYLDDVSVIDVTDEINNRQVQQPFTAIPASYFGMHIHKAQDSIWPNIGFGMLRLWDTGTKWSELEQQKDTFINNRLNTYINLRNTKDTLCDIMLTLGSPASWASFQGDEFTKDGISYDFYKSVDKNKLQDWKDYIQYYANNYKQIKYWEIWNEVEHFFTEEGEDRLTLVELAEAAYDIIKAADPNNVVLSPNFTTSLAASEFLYKSKGKKCFDVFSFHSYYYDKSPELEIGFWYGFREMLDANGMTDIPLFNTEGAQIKGFDSISGNYQEREGSVSRAYILQWAYGISNFNWYYWEPYVDGDDDWSKYGTVLSKNDSNSKATIFTRAGEAYATTASWLKGKVMFNKQIDTNGNWIISLYNPQTANDEFIVWNPNNNSSTYNAPVGYISERLTTETTGANIGFSLHFSS